MRKKEAIYTSNPTVTHLGWSTPQPRIEIRQIPHAAPKAAEDREVFLVLNIEQALDLALKIIGQLPVMVFEANPIAVESLEKTLAIVKRS